MDDRADLLAVAYGGLLIALSELDSLSATDVPMPDSVERAFRERDAACGVLRRVLRAAPSDRRRRLGAMIREELAAARGGFSDELGTYPVLPEVMRTLDEAAEVFRRRRLVDPEAQEAIELAESRTSGMR